MLGNPKFNAGDVVTFSLDDQVVKGVVYVVDAYGTCEDNSDVSYDIMQYRGNMPFCLYKHIREDFVTLVERPTFSARCYECKTEFSFTQSDVIDSIFVKCPDCGTEICIE